MCVNLCYWWWRPRQIFWTKHTGQNEPLLPCVLSAWSHSGLLDRWFGYDMVNCKDFCFSKVIVCTNHRLHMRKIPARCWKQKLIMSPRVIGFAGNCGDTYCDLQWDMLAGSRGIALASLVHILYVQRCDLQLLIYWYYSLYHSQCLNWNF